MITNNCVNDYPVSSNNIDGMKMSLYKIDIYMIEYTPRFQRLPPARGGTAQKKILHLANWSQLIHPGPASRMTKVFVVESVVCVNAASLHIRAATTSTSGTLNDLTTDLIMANNNNTHQLQASKLCELPIKQII